LGLLPVFRFRGLLLPAGLVSVDSLLPGIELLGIAPPDNGLGGRLAVLIPRGGCGNALILIVFLIVLPALFTPGVDFDFGVVELPPGVVGSVRCVAEGARRPLFGRLGGVKEELDSEPFGILPVLFLVFETGRAGRAVFGGP
jgi:hypothetical protein